MMKLMFNANDGGFHNFQEDELDEAKKAGWVDGEPIRQKLLDAKRKPVAKPVETVTLTAQPEIRRPGRPRNVAPSILNDREL